MNAGTKKKKAAPKLTLQNLDLTQKLTIEDSNKCLEIDLSDKRIANRILKLVKRYQGIEDELKEKLAAAEKIKDELDKMIAVSDIEVDTLESFKKDVDDAFGTNITEIMFGDCLPGIERYTDLFETLTPVIQAYSADEKKRVEALNKKYSLERVK